MYKKVINVQPILHRICIEMRGGGGGGGSVTARVYTKE
jgi:hypothetical protein